MKLLYSPDIPALPQGWEIWEHDGKFLGVFQVRSVKDKIIADTVEEAVAKITEWDKAETERIQRMMEPAPEGQREPLLQRLDTLFKKHDVSPEKREELYTLLKEFTAIRKGEPPAAEDEATQESGDAEDEDKFKCRLKFRKGMGECEWDLTIPVSLYAVGERVRRLDKFLEVFYVDSIASPDSDGTEEARGSYAIDHVWQELRIINLLLIALEIEMGSNTLPKAREEFEKEVWGMESTVREYLLL